MNITILLDRSYSTALRASVTKELYSFLMLFCVHLPVRSGASVKHRFRFGAFGSAACCLCPASQTAPGPKVFPFSLFTFASSAHEEWSEDRMHLVLECLKGQPFPLLGADNIRQVLLQATTGSHAADHVVVITSWAPGTQTDNTWQVMQSVASVTLVNLEEVVPPTFKQRFLGQQWWVDSKEATAKKLAKKCAFANPKYVRFSPPVETVQKLTRVEQLQQELLQQFKESSCYLSLHHSEDVTCPSTKAICRARE